MEDFILKYDGRMSHSVANRVGRVNKAISDFVLEVFERSGFKPYDVRREDYYFVFSGFPFWVTRFRLRGVWPGWCFGLWTYGERMLDDSPSDKLVMQIFCQHETAIDKFKPSASELSFDFTKGQFERMIHPSGSVPDDYVIRMLVDFARQIRRHPFMSYYGLMSPGRYPMPERFVPYTVRCMLDECDLRRRLCVWMLTRRAKDMCEAARTLDFVESCGMQVRSKGWSPRVEVTCRLNCVPTEEQADRILEIIPKLYYGGHRYPETMYAEIIYMKDGEEYMVCGD